MNKNTDTSGGGTRFSADKVSCVWTPWLGVAKALCFAKNEGYFLPGRGNALYHTIKAIELTGLHIQSESYTNLSLAAGHMLIVAGRCIKDGVAASMAAGVVEVCVVSEHGALKYAPLDWLLGQSHQTLLNSAFRHMLHEIGSGPFARDEESGHLSAAHAAWNLLCLVNFIEAGRDDLDDITPWVGVSATKMRELGLSPDASAAELREALR